jgi:hypothetical protein
MRRFEHKKAAVKTAYSSVILLAWLASAWFLYGWCRRLWLWLSF